MTIGTAVVLVDLAAETPGPAGFWAGTTQHCRLAGYGEPAVAPPAGIVYRLVGSNIGRRVSCCPACCSYASTPASTGIRPSKPLIRSIFATSGCGAKRAKRHPAVSAWLAIWTKALSPPASQKDRPTRSSSSTRAERSMD